jgi:anaerobic selenocysteine-containing dehydrogenase
MMGYLFMPGGGGPFEMGYSKNPWMAGPAPSPATTGAIFIPLKWYTPTAFNLTKWQKAVLLRPQYDKGTLSLADFNGAIGMAADALPVNIKVINFPSAMKNHCIDIFGASERIQAVKQVFTWGQYWYYDSAARYMDILLPAVERFMEEPGEGLAAFGGAMNRFIGNSNSYNNLFEYASPAVAPQGEARPEEWVWLMLAKRFGVDSSYNPALAPVFTQDQWDWNTWNTAVEAAHQKAYETWAQDPKVAPLNPPSWTDFKKKPVWRYDAIQTGPYANWLGNNQNPFANTNSKLLEPSSQVLSSPSVAATTLLGNEYGYTGFCFGKIGPAATAVPKWFNNLEYTAYDPKANNFSLVLITPNSYYRSHSSGFNNPYLHGDCYQHRVWISPYDASARGISDGDQVRVFSDVGELNINAYVTPRMTPGVVAIYHGGHYQPNQNKTALMPDGVDTGGAPNFLLADVQPGNMVNGPDIGSGPVEIQKI